MDVCLQAVGKVVQACSVGDAAGQRGAGDVFDFIGYFVPCR